VVASFPLLTLDGPPAVRGLAYGRAASDRIRDGIAFYASVLADTGLGRVRLRQLTNIATAEIGNFDAGMLEELEGIAAGACVGLGDVVLLNARSELLRLSDEGCTGIACLPETTASHHTLLAQNWDWHPTRSAAGVLLRILPDDGPAMLTFTEAGTLARCGLNDHGLGVVGNALECEGGTRAGGVPVGLIRRRILGCSTLAEAAEAVRAAPRGTSANHLIASVENAAVACESTPDEVYEVVPEHGMLSHSNHFCSPAAQAAVRDTGIARTPDTLARARRLHDLLSGRRPLDVGDVQEVLRDHDGYPVSICRHADATDARTWTTVASIVMDLDARRLWLGVGPPCQHPYADYPVTQAPACTPT
jgi:isopenicillin-N N-acyltransferase-like protein